MTNPFIEDAISGYNANPPSNDGTESVANTCDWTLQVIGKVGDPLKNYAAANFANITMAFGKVLGGAGITSVATNYAVLSTDRSKLIVVSGGSGVTVTTPDAGIVGQTFAFGVVNITSEDVTFAGNGSQTINGNATITLHPQSSTLVVSDGSNWFTYAAPNDPSRTSVFITGQSIEASVADGNVVYWDDGNSEWTKALAGTTVATGLGIADVTNGRVYGVGLVSMTFDQGALTQDADLYLSGGNSRRNHRYAAGGCRQPRAGDLGNRIVVQPAPRKADPRTACPDRGTDGERSRVSGLHDWTRRNL